MNCPKCQKKLPKSNPRVCPSCGKDLTAFYKMKENQGHIKTRIAEIIRNEIAVDYAEIIAVSVLAPHEGAKVLTQLDSVIIAAGIQYGFGCLTRARPELEH